MSYIRCLSNPEGYYIVTNTRGQTEFLGDGYLTMPDHIFRGLLSKWYRDRESVTYRGGRIIKTKDFRYELYYENWPRVLPFWEVTLTYICTQNERKLKVKRKKR